MSKALSGLVPLFQYITRGHLRPCFDTVLSDRWIWVQFNRFIQAQSPVNTTFYYDDLKLSLNNMIGYYQTGNLISSKLGSYDLQNVIFRNGVSVEGSMNFKMFDEPTSWEIQFTDVRVTGDKWFIDGFEEITATFGTRRRQARMDWQTLRVGAGLTLGKSFQGGQIMFTYRF